MSVIYDLALIKAANHKHGGHFFSPGALRFFRSRVSEKVHQGPGGIYFVTSEQFDERSPRLYTVRRFCPTSRGVDTVGEFQQHATSRQAHAEAARLAVQVPQP
ncbi:DUF7447 family protein [Hymenobacter jeollabukensis]|uniref:Uncharacterized protein n=1 Tax=Hymenobacter jeollabukensis TaxID=2025313 RepID=A0A5R8WGU1_9BACT|nr:hypothetical protein [Hymenobacter jeollabukensis]TLM87299.1 hypothetical protein FDY95_26105 [Hymenobacter jeollabukensis]